MDLWEFGRPDAPVVLLLLETPSPRLAESPLCQKLGRLYRMIIPRLPRRPGTRETDELDRLLQERCGGSVYAVCCTEGTWTLLRTLLARRRISPVKVLLEETAAGAPETAVDLVEDTLMQ